MKTVSIKSLILVLIVMFSTTLSGCFEWFIPDFDEEDGLPTTAEVTILQVGFGTVTQTATYDINEYINITATPVEHYQFAGWQLNGEIVSTEATYGFYVTEDVTYTAIFEERTDGGFVLVEVMVNGSVASNSFAHVTGEGFYVYGDVVTLFTSENYPNIVFLHWSDDNYIITENQTYTFTMSEYTATTFYAVYDVITDPIEGPTEYQ